MRLADVLACLVPGPPPAERLDLIGELAGIKPAPQRKTS